MSPVRAVVTGSITTIEIDGVVIPAALLIDLVETIAEAGEVLRLGNPVRPGSDLGVAVLSLANVLKDAR